MTYMYTVRVHVGTQSRNGDQEKKKLLFDTDQPLIELYIALGCLDG
jgi:hypothetical protein